MTVTAKLRLSSLVAFLVQRVQKKERTVVFMSTCDGVDYHEALFTAMDCILASKNDETQDNHPGLFGNACPIYKLHGSVPHAERQSILTRFNKDKTALLIATDVAARGLNLARVNWTVQYDPPCEVADYAHRAGRAARAGKAGHSLLFLLPSERQFLDVLELKGVKGMVPLSLAHTLNKAAEICSDFTAESNAGHRNKGEAFSAEIQRRLEDTVTTDDAQTKAAYKAPARKKGQRREQEPNGRLLELARKAFFSYVRAYPTKEKAVRHIFSSRALHVGHIARSFALKEPPKSSFRAASQSAKEGEENNGGGDDRKKRNLTFSSLVEEAQDVVEKAKRQKQQHNKKPNKKINLIKSDGTVDSTKARMMLMERAAKMQQGNMDSF
jgi:ATP-dependent RNA helicase DDX31/DBP7